MRPYVLKIILRAIRTIRRRRLHAVSSRRASKDEAIVALFGDRSTQSATYVAGISWPKPRKSGGLWLVDAKCGLAQREHSNAQCPHLRYWPRRTPALATARRCGEIGAYHCCLHIVCCQRLQLKPVVPTSAGGELSSLADCRRPLLACLGAIVRFAL